jgi:divalent metal cation (Fe/Co/Zn/Cd) transporter
MLHIAWADGAASIAIGLLLVGVSAVLANETRSLIAGEAVAGPIMEELHRVLAADSRIVQIDEIATMHLGPQAILMALTLRFRSELSIPALDDAIREITFTLQAVEKRELSANVCKSETVTLGDPVMPVGDRFGG